MDLKGAANKYKKMAKAAPKFQKDFLSTIGDLLMNELEETTPVDTGELRRSWVKGSVQNNGMVYYLPIANIKEYASYVEDGHRQTKRFLPGDIKGKKFVYNPDADGGIMLSDKWIEGKHMYRISSKKIKDRMPALFHEEFKLFFDSFGGE